jgi:hypothetical protein
MSNSNLKVKRTVQKLTNGDRKWICHRRINFKDEKFTDMQAAFRDERNADIELKSGTVSGILKQADKWLSIQDGQEAGTRTRSSKEPELEAALFAWRSEQIAKQEKVRDEDLRDKARELAAAMGINTDRCSKGLSFSSGWLDRFKKRNSIKQTKYNRHGKKDAEKQGDLGHPSTYSQLSAVESGNEHAAAAVGAHNPAAAIHGVMPYLPSQIPSVMQATVPGIPSVPHSLSMPQAEGVPAAIPQPPSGASEHDDASMMHPAGLFRHQLGSLGSPDAGANGAQLAGVAVGAQVQGMPLGPHQVPQATYSDVPRVPAPIMPHDPYQDAAMGIPAPVGDPGVYPPGAIPMSPTHGAAGPMMIAEQPQLQLCVPASLSTCLCLIAEAEPICFVDTV